MEGNINEVHIRKTIQCECYNEVRCGITSEVISGKTYRVNRPMAVDFEFKEDVLVDAVEILLVFWLETLSCGSLLHLKCSFYAVLSV